MSCFLLTGSKAKRLLMATTLMKMFCKKNESIQSTMMWNELKQVSVCGRSDMNRHERQSEKESTLWFERQQQKEENQWQSRDQRGKCLDAYAGRAVHYRSVQLGSNCSHDFNLSRDDEDGRISDLMLLSIKEEEGKRAKVVRNTEVVVVPLKIRWRLISAYFFSPL